MVVARHGELEKRTTCVQPSAQMGRRGSAGDSKGIYGHPIFRFSTTNITCIIRFRRLGKTHPAKDREAPTKSL